MRIAFAALVLLGSAALAAQPPKEPPKVPGKEPPKEQPKEPPPKDDEFVPTPKEAQPRYGVKPRVKQYPQDTPKTALKSAFAAIEAADYPYLVGHLLDPKFVDDAVAERIKLFEPGVLDELTQKRDFQRANPDRVVAEDRVPLDPKAFGAMAYAKARERAFKLLIKDISQKLADDPQTIKDIRRIIRDGSFADADPIASATHAEVKGRALFFRKIGDRWFLENRQTEEPKKEP